MKERQLAFTSSSRVQPSLRLLVRPVLAAAAAELPELQALRRRLLILRRHVITTFAFRALQHNVIAWHKSLPTLLMT